MELHKEPVELSWFVMDFIERNKAEDVPMPEINFYCAEESIIGIWDSCRLEQAISNLLANALKFGEGKAIEISIEKDAKNKLARFSIRDYGIGIPLEMQDVIFNKFERGTNNQNVPGLGLGLYIVQKIVEAHGR